MNFIRLCLIIAVFIPAIICSRRSSHHQRAATVNELILHPHGLVKINPQCNWITYDVDLHARFRGNSYQCPNHTLVKGSCVLPWSSAIAQCNTDPACDGLVMTTDLEWHKTYDSVKEPAVQLYKPPVALTPINVDWRILVKHCWVFAS